MIVQTSMNTTKQRRQIINPDMYDHTFYPLTNNPYLRAKGEKKKKKLKLKARKMSTCGKC